MISAIITYDLGDYCSQDLTFSEDALVLRHNAELADTFGNLVHRALVLCAKFCGGAVIESSDRNQIS